ncbi:MAG: type VI secretion system tip protein TssI/VgrG [Isosphaeraceae bacterium]
MATYVQADRFLSVKTPLGPDVLLLRGLSGHEAISQLFNFRLDLAVENGTTVSFDKLLGQPISASMTLHQEKTRYFNGICSRVSEGGQDATFTYYRMMIVPQLWFLTRIAQSRIFQHLSIPDILKKVLKGLDVTYEIKGTFQPRDFCVQYRETDFNFASRLMEEEGLFYFFKHTSSGHQMVIGNTPQSHPDLPEQSQVEFDVSSSAEHRGDRITTWEKVQELRPGKYTLWDHSFELPHKHLEASQVVQDSVQVGTVNHKLKIGANEKLELYDYPGEYAQRFDGIDSGGGAQPADLQKIFDDNARTVGLRMQSEAMPGLEIRGSGMCRYLASGHKFTLSKHFNADGAYVLTGVQHDAQLAGDYRSNMGSEITYQNSFTCIPSALPFRPTRSTPKPFVQGTQTAVVVGPAGEEIFTDKYSRVKVQFHWDREGKNDSSSSCWVRVGTPWAGKQWGAIHIPRIGQEVVVAFEEGDPDRPIIVGSVYNADMMPPYTLPDNKTQSGIKSRSTLKGTPENFNELRFEDKKDSEQVYFHAEKNFDRVVENNDTLKVGFEKKDKGDQSIEIFNNQSLKVGCSQASDGSQTIDVYKNRTETVETGNETVTIKKGNRAVYVDTGNDTHEVKTGNRTVLIDMGNDTLTIKMGNQTTKLNLGASSTEAMQSITLKVGQSSIKVDQTGVTIAGMMIKINGQVQTQVNGLMTQINGNAMLQCKGGITMIN